MTEILEESRRPKCPHPGNGCWYVDENDGCANAGRVAARHDTCENNRWGMMPTEIVTNPGLDRDVWRKERGLKDAVPKTPGATCRTMY